MSFGGLDFFGMILLSSAAGSREERVFGEVESGEMCGDSPLLVLRYSCLSCVHVSLAVCSCNDVFTRGPVGDSH